MGIAAAFAFVAEQMVLLGHRALTIDTNSRNIGRFARYCERGLGLETVDQVTPEVVRAFVYAPSARNKPPSPATMHGRRTAVRLAFRILIQFGLHDSDPTRFVELPPRSELRARPLTEDENELVRWASLATLIETRQPAIVALAEASAVSSEIPLVTAPDVDLDQATVVLSGCHTAEPRLGHLSDWGVLQMARRIRSLDDPTVPLVYAGERGGVSGQASVAGTLSGVLTRSGLATEADVGVSSIRNRAGLVAYQRRYRIEDAALVLGARGLDTAAALIGLHWQERP